MLREAFQDLNRVRQIAAVVAKHGFGAYLERTKLGDAARERAPATQGPGRPVAASGGATAAAAAPAPAPAAEEEGPDAQRRTAARFRQLLLDLGPTFIKLGQLLSSRPDILPGAWIEELSELQDSVPPFPLAEVRAEIERGLGKRVEELFATLHPEPLASASIAQVHRATTHAGERVVVKVQRPRIREQIEADLPILFYLARLLEAVIEETGIYTPAGIIEEFDRAIHEELDFGNEARNAREMAEASRGRDFLVIPRVHGALSSSTVLTLDYVEGVKVSEVSPETGFDPEQVAKNIIEASFRQLFDDGLFHGDPHPGNILVLPGNRIALLDFGLVGRLTRPMQEALVTLIMAVALRDADTVARVLNRVGVPDQHSPITLFRADIAGILDRYLGLRLDEIRTSTLLRDLLDLAIKHKIRIPKEYAVLSKAAISIEGIIRRLHPKLDVLEIGLPYAKELLFARFNPTDASGTMMKSLLKLQGLAEDVPAQLSQILMDLESGKFRVNVHSDGLDRLASNVRALGLSLFTALLAAALLVGGLTILARELESFGALRFVGLAALFAAAMLFGASLTVYLLGGPRRKISLRRWLRK